MLASSEQAWYPIAALSAKSCSKTTALPSSCAKYRMPGGLASGDAWFANITFSSDRSISAV
jgi:hypothetical protein